jgi:hypothetical protein
LFEIHGLILALHYEARFLKLPGSLDRAVKGFESILERNGAKALPADQSKARSPSSLRSVK